MSDALVGTDGMSITSLLIICAIVVVVIGLIVWRLRRRGHMAFIRGGSNRQPRLAVLDAAAVDVRRRLVLVRRDNVEHLIMIGGPSDIVVERGINRVAAAPRPGSETTVTPTPQQAEAAHLSVAKSHQQPAQPQAPQRPEPPYPAIPQPEIIATEAQNSPNSNPAKKRGRQPKADTSPDRKRAAYSLPPAPETTQPPPPPQEAEPSSPARMEAKPVPQEAIAGLAPQRTDKPPAPPPELAAVAVSAAAASAADQMAKLDDRGEDAGTESPVVEAESPDLDVKDPVVEKQAAAVATATIPDEENVITAELEDVEDAARELVMPEETKTEPDAAEEIIAAPPADLEPSISDVPVVGAADIRETGNAVQPDPMTAEELIADFDELLEAEISKAEQQKSESGPEYPTSPAAEFDAKRSAGVPSASLEDEMKKLLGDLNVKQ